MVLDNMVNRWSHMCSPTYCFLKPDAMITVVMVPYSDPYMAGHIYTLFMYCNFN